MPISATASPRRTNGPAGRCLVPFAVATLLALPTAAQAEPPRYAPDFELMPGFDGSVTLGDLLRHSNYRPSALVHEVLRAEGRSYDPDAPAEVDSFGLVPKSDSGGGIHIVGEVLVFEGDDTIVTDFGDNRYGLRYDNGRQDPIRITGRYVENFGEDVDFIAVWTSFRDRGAEGLAYYVPIVQDTQGLGERRFDQSRLWGLSDGGRIQGFLNMKSISTYGDITNPNNYVYPVIGQELTHRWLAYFKARQADGTVSDFILGRDLAHWSSLLDADGSVQDGHSWRDNGDGTFTVTESMMRFSALDLYGMGLFSFDEVPPFFIIEDATRRGQPVSRAATLPVGFTVDGTRTEITIDNIVSANGLRRPTPAESQKDFRMVFILVTAPGETVEDVRGQIETISTFQAIWEEKYTEWTYGRSTLCTRVTADCDRPQLRILSSSLDAVDAGQDAMLSPGDAAALSITVANTGGSPAEAPEVHVVVPDGVDIIAENSPARLPDLAVGEELTIDGAISVAIGPDAPCGTDVRLRLEATTGGLLSASELVVPIGYDFIFWDDFDTDLGWIVNEEGLDTATEGLWERAVPEGVNARRAGLDFQTQPAGGFAGEANKAYVTGAAAGSQLGSNDIDNGTTSVTSPEISLAETRDPFLGYYSWHTALDFNSVPRAVVADDNDPLVVEISPDGGLSWVLVEEDRTNAQEWLEKRWRILDFLHEIPPTIRVRFTAMDMDPQSLSEAAFDRVRVWDWQPSCYGPVEVPAPDDPSDPVDDPAGPGLPSPPTDGTQPLGAQASGGCAGSGAPETWVALLCVFGGLALLSRRRRDHLAPPRG